LALASAVDQISRAVERVRAEVPALAKLKLVFGVELTPGGLTGRGESERFRVELPGPRVSEGAGDDERIRLSIPRTMFNLLAEEGELADWREAYQFGHLKVDGDPRIQRLLGRAIGRS
jgi:hypothetical protein